MSSAERRRQEHRRHQGVRHRLQRRFPRAQLRKILFFVLLIAASLTAGYVVSRYEASAPVHRE